MSTEVLVCQETIGCDQVCLSARKLGWDRQVSRCYTEVLVSENTVKKCLESIGCTDQV